MYLSNASDAGETYRYHGFANLAKCWNRKTERALSLYCNALRVGLHACGIGRKLRFPDIDAFTSPAESRRSLLQAGSFQLRKTLDYLFAGEFMHRVAAAFFIKGGRERCGSAFLHLTGPSVVLNARFAAELIGVYEDGMNGFAIVDSFYKAKLSLHRYLLLGYFPMF
jgi:hypothetical protein